MVSSSNPTVLTQYPRAQKCIPVTFLYPALRWILTALFPFMNPKTNATLYLGGIFKHIWTWSGIRCPSRTSISFCRARSLKISPTSRFTFPYNTLFRYFGTMTTWYLQSHRTCDKLSQSCIGFSSIIPQRGFPRGGAYIIFAGSVEPIRVHHWKWWFSGQIIYASCLPFFPFYTL